MGIRNISKYAMRLMILTIIVISFIAVKAEASSAMTWKEVQDKLNSVDPSVTIEYGSSEPHGIVAGPSDGPLVARKGKSSIIYMHGQINRNLTEPKENGYVLRVEGKCELVGYFPDNSIRGGNNTGGGGGIYVAKGGELWLDAYVSNNKAKNGGGIYVAEGGRLIINRYSNSPDKGYGWIFKNTASEDGGGIYVEKGGTVIQTGGEIYDNICEKKSSVGYGVLVKGSYQMDRGTISDHISQCDGAGVAVDGGEFLMTGGNICKNKTGRITGDGAGVLVMRNGQMEMTGGNIFWNESNGCGAGVCVQHGGSFDMSGGSIQLNECSSIVSSSGGYVLEMGDVMGAGVFMADGNVTLHGSPVIKNNKSIKKDGTYQDNLYVYMGMINISGKLDPTADVNVRTIHYPDNQVITTGLPCYASPDQMKCDLSEYTAISSNQDGYSGEAEYVKKSGLTTHKVKLLDKSGKEIAPYQIIKDGGKVTRVHPINGYYTIFYGEDLDDPYDFNTPVTQDMNLIGISEPRKKFKVKYDTGIEGFDLEMREGVNWLDQIYPKEHGQEKELFSEHGGSFGGWFIDKYFKKEYKGETYSEIAKKDTVEEVTLYAKSSHTHDGKEFFAWNDPDSLPSEPGCYYLETDVTLPSDEERWKRDGEFRICLNGHTIRREGKTDSEYYKNDSVLQANDILYLYDEPGMNGKITGGYSEYNGGGIRVCGTFIMYGGTITGNTAKNGGGVGVDANGHFKMYGGTITGNECDPQGDGGGVYVDYSELMERYVGFITKMTIGSGGTTPPVITDNKCGSKASDVSLPGGKSGKYINIDGKLDPGTKVGISLRTKLEKTGDKTRVTSGFGDNAGDNSIQFYANDIGANGLPYNTDDISVDGVREKYVMYGYGGDDGMEKNPMTVKAKKLTVKAKILKKKALKFKVKKYLAVKKAKGKVTYRKIKGKKAFSINKKTGKLTIKKGLKKGTYTIKVKVTAKGNAKYLPGYKTVKARIKIR